jgi:hypothetical protein
MDGQKEESHGNKEIPHGATGVYERELVNDLIGNVPSSLMDIPLTVRIVKFSWSW